MDHREGVWPWWRFSGEWATSIVLRFWGLFICKCMKISVSDIERQVKKSEEVIIMVTLNHNVKESQMNVLQYLKIAVFLLHPYRVFSSLTNNSQHLLS